MSTLNEPTGLSVYLTHNTLIPLKKPIQELEKNPSAVKIVARLKNGIYSITKTDHIEPATLSLPQNGGHYLLNEQEFKMYIQQLQGLTNIARTRLMCDANLGEAGDDHLTALMHQLVEELRPAQLILFTNNEHCVAEGMLYLQGNHAEFNCPDEVQQGFCSGTDSNEFLAKIVQGAHLHMLRDTAMENPTADPEGDEITSLFRKRLMTNIQDANRYTPLFETIDEEGESDEESATSNPMMGN